MLPKAEIKKRIATYEDSLKYWKKQMATAKAEAENCKKMIKKYKEDLKNS